MFENFYDKYVNGEVEFNKIYDYIAEWHVSDSTLELHEYLGLTEEQYDYFLERDEIFIREEK